MSDMETGTLTFDPDTIMNIGAEFVQHYSWERAYPPISDIAKKYNFGPKEYREVERFVNNLLEKTGYPPVEFSIPKVPKEPKKPKAELEPQFILACEIMTNTLDKRSAATKLKDAGLSTARWRNMLNEPKHAAYFQKKMELAWGLVDDQARLSLIRAVEAGDLQAIKYLNEWKGTYRPNQELVLNVGIIIGKIMEILVKHVDPAILVDVADELDSLMVGTTKEIESAGKN